MRRCDRWASVALSLLVAACGIAREAAPRCNPGATVSCACAHGDLGVQSCRADGTLDTCDCSASSRCEPGALFACACPAGGPGTQVCNAEGRFDPCVCGDPATNRCIPGTAAGCSCASGESGAQVCSADGVFGVCTCEPAPERCVPGATSACACSDGLSSIQTCGDDGRFAPCECGYLDAQVPDGGADAGAGVCDPFVAPSCGCPEVTPPTTPTLTPPEGGRLVSGGEVLVDLFATEAGVAVVLRTGVRLFSRTGAELARWDAPRELQAVAFDGERLAVADPSTITVLALDLTEGAHVALTSDCDAAGMISCGRMVCVGSSSGPPNVALALYDTIGATQLSSIDYFSNEEWYVRRVPGIDAVLVGSGFVLVDEADQLLYTSSARAVGAKLVGFHGSPARHAIAPDGRMYRLDACTVPDPLTSHCFERDGSVGTLRANERIVAMERGSDARLYALVTTASETTPAAVCARGCTLQRIDVDAHVVESGGFVTFSVPNDHDPIRLRHDAWAGRVLLGLPGSCAPTYPYACTGWSVLVVPYD